MEAGYLVTIRLIKRFSQSRSYKVRNLKTVIHQSDCLAQSNNLKCNRVPLMSDENDVAFKFAFAIPTTGVTKPYIEMILGETNKTFKFKCLICFELLASEK